MGKRVGKAIELNVKMLFFVDGQTPVGQQQCIKFLFSDIFPQNCTKEILGLVCLDHISLGTSL
jgi:hypothetical protein